MAADAQITVLDYRRARSVGASKVRGEWLMVIDKDDIAKLAIDWSRWLDGEAVSTTTYTASGVTTASAAEAAGVTTVLVSGDGELEVQVTSSGGRKLTQAFRLRERTEASVDGYAA